MTTVPDGPVVPEATSDPGRAMEAGPLNSVARLRAIGEMFPIAARNSDQLAEAVIYLRNLVAQHPTFGCLPTWWRVVDIAAVPGVGSHALCLDLDDGTTIRIHVERYPRS